MCRLCLEKPFFKGGTFLINRDGLKSQYHMFVDQIDTDCQAYLGEVLGNRDCYVPLRAPGDGNCLLHAICLAISGEDDYHVDLRALMASELSSNAEWYKSIVELSGPDWDKIIDLAENDGKFLEFVHIFALSNILNRPIILLASNATREHFGGGDGGVTATFLPTRNPFGKSFAPPVVIAWATQNLNHFVPIVPVMKVGEYFPTIEAIPPIAWEHSMPPGAQLSDYLFDTPYTDKAYSYLECHLPDSKSPETFKITIAAYTDPYTLAQETCKRLCVGIDRLQSFVHFFEDVAAAHDVPLALSLDSFKAWGRLIGNKLFPAFDSHISPPLTPIDKLSSIVLTQASQPEFELSPEENQLMNELLSSLQFKTQKKLELAPIKLLVDLLKRWKKPAPLFGILNILIAGPPSITSEPIKELQIPQLLRELIADPTQTQLNQVVIVRCLASLFNTEYGTIPFKTCYQHEIRSIIRSLIQDIDIKHIPTLCAFLYNYAIYVSSTQFFVERVRLEALELLASFSARCLRNIQAAGSEKCMLDSLVAIGTLLVAQPELIPRAMEIVLPSLNSCNQIESLKDIVFNLKSFMIRPKHVTTIEHVKTNIKTRHL